jgi:hypothetical protein
MIGCKVALSVDLIQPGMLAYIFRLQALNQLEFPLFIQPIDRREEVLAMITSPSPSIL